MLKNKPELRGYTYTYEESLDARDNNKLLSIRLETSLICNLRCVYCCNKSGKPSIDEMGYDQLLNIIDQAKNLGTRSIVVIGGGEPTLYPHFRELISYINSLSLIPVIFTNTTTMTYDLACYLFRENVTVIVKLDSLDEMTQDELAGVEGTYKKIRIGMENLIKAGFTKYEDTLRLGASFVVSKKNIHEIPDIWRYCRQKKIYPNLEMMIPNGFAEDIKDELLTAADWKKLKLELLEIDEREFDITWDANQTFCNGCRQMMYNLYVTVNGIVRPCSSIHLERYKIDYNINNMSIKEIIQSPLYEYIRNIDKNVSGKCSKCVHNPKCYGCRAMAYYEGYKNGLPLYGALSYEDNTCAFYKPKI